MANFDYTLYKLIVLYMLNKVDFPLTNTQITNCILDKEYTTYFILQQTLAELVDGEYIKTETNNNVSTYTITSVGKETLEMFHNKISDTIKQEIEQYLLVNKYELKEKNSVISYYSKSNNADEFIVNLSIIEDSSHLVDIALTVPSEQLAKKMCTNWSHQSLDIYSFLVKKLQE